MDDIMTVVASVFLCSGFVITLEMHSYLSNQDKNQFFFCLLPPIDMRREPNYSYLTSLLKISPSLLSPLK